MDTMETTGVTRMIEKNKLFLKSLIIGAMALALWLPTNIILELVKERAARQQEAVADISSKWAGKQLLITPVLCIPYVEQNAGNTVSKQLFIFPDKNDIQARVIPEKRYRGIYQVAVYHTNINMKGSFKKIPLQELNIAPSNVQWNESKLLFKVLDPIRGINEDLNVDWNGNNVSFNGQFKQSGSLENAFEALLPLQVTDGEKEQNYSMNFSLNGSSQLLFAPLARENNLQINSSWSDPGFTGIKLPDTRKIDETGFTATWKYMNRTIPGTMEQANFDSAATGFGVDLLIPVDNYDKTERSVKYALLCIMLTFASFFLIETIYKRPLHLVQYGLAGLALVLFYTLLLSISEYLGYDLAYLIAGAATIGLVTWFVGSIMHSSKIALFISLVLAVVYTYIYTIIQLQDYSLLMGSIGLFVALGIIMFFSRKLQWSVTTPAKTVVE